MAEFTSYKSGIPCWVDVSSRDLGSTRNFYGSLFGWEVEDLGAEAGNYSFFTLGGKPVAGTGPLMSDAMPSMWNSYVKVDDADDTASKVSASGGTIVMPTMDVMGTGRLMMFTDSSGVPLGVWQPGTFAGSALANEPGAFTWNELHSRDPGAAKSFYTSVFPWSEKTEDYGGHPYTMWMIGDAPAGGMMPLNPSTPAEVPGYWLVYFHVEDPDACATQANETGGSVTVPAMDSPAGRFAILADPAGAVFAVIRPAS